MSQGHTKCCPVPSTHVTYAPVKFEVAMSITLDGNVSTRKYITKVKVT